MDSDPSFNERVRATVFDLLTEANRVPFLFVGSGVSQRYMGTENWADLLKWVIASTHSPRMKPYFAYYQAALAEVGEDRALIRAASNMERDFLGVTLEPGFDEWRRRHGDELDAGSPAMKIYIAEHLRDFSPCRLTEELQLLRGASTHVAGVITTNYDLLMENVFPDYDRYVGQEELLFSSLSGLGEIYKIHGSVEDPESMVLDERDYDLFRERQSYLMSKVLTIFGEYPVVFLGYSLSDPDIGNIITSLAECAGERHAREMARRFIFIDYSSFHRIDGSMNFKVGNSFVSMTAIHTDDFSPVYRAIGDLDQRFAPKVLGQLARQIFQAADLSSDHTKKVYFTDLEGLRILPPDMEVVVGLGGRDYGRPVNVTDMYEDVLFDDKTFDAKLVVGAYLDTELKKNPGGLPMYKYLSQYDGRITGEKILSEIHKRNSMGSYLSKTDLSNKRKNRAKLGKKSVGGLIDVFGKEKAYERLTSLNPEEIQTEDLLKYLREISSCKVRKKKKGEDVTVSMLDDANFRKCVRIYDFLKYRELYERKARLHSHRQ
ncbi:SIR2-like domain-containing protein [Bifidobacterium margollesii]|uniref:SIR2-like domain-containing protein n=1 Tax=Bifidobacterium margollesii TaxID=2020964 RepID=A0A2N5J706_9BIFI|nr:SIR2 family protein [Bifidobacterium margollesii]PLS29984.1 SIR2-like domain-containing protein [Bifidobacterium margollesii]